jgi:tetratricopeptide (TPR) repeat protein
MGFRLLLILALLGGTATAEITVSARVDPAIIQMGESAEFGVEIGGTQGVPAPEVPAVDGITLRYLGPATQVSFVNGQISQSVTHRFSVAATRPGTFTIGPVGFVVEGKRHEAAAVTLTVRAAGAQPGQGGEGLRLVLSVAKPEVYLHERVPLSLQLWVGNTRVTNLQYPNIGGDGVAIDKLPQQPAQRREQTPEGVFQVVDFATTLTPLRSGTLTVGPATMRLEVLVRTRGGGDPFFGDVFGETRRPRELASAPLTLTVLPLPEADRPADFTGAVGRFEMEVDAAPLALGVGDPVTITSKIRGTGNFESVSPPTIAASEELRVYPVQQTGQPGTGERIFEQVVIPQRAGTVTLPALRFSYFDPEARAYRTLSEPPVMLTVRAGATPERGPQVVGAVVPRTPAEKLGRDIVFIKDSPGTLGSVGARRHRRVAFWALQAVPLLAWLAAVAYDRRRRRLTGDVRYARFTRAGRAAREAIAGARQKLQAGERAAFYDALARAVSEYLAAKLDLPPGDVTAATVGERLRRTGLSSAAHDLEEFFSTCERARFAPATDASADMQRTLERADAIVRALERERRLARAVAAACLLLAAAAHAGAAPAVESPNTMFFRGNTAYGEEKYAEAAVAYEQLLGAGLASGNLYFNLGNAYFKAGDVGRAILNYERARRLVPGDPDLIANLGYARSLAGTSDEPPVWARLLFPLADRFSSDALLLAASGLYALLMSLLIAARLLPARARGARVAAGVVGVTLALVVPSAVYRLATVDLPATGVVVARGEATVRFEPSPAGTAHFQAKAGSVLRLEGEREGWVQVKRADGRRGWVEREAVAALEAHGSPQAAQHPVDS